MLATIDRGFEILVKVLHDDRVVHLEPPSKKIAHRLAIDFVAFSFKLMQFQQPRPDVLRPIEGRHEQVELQRHLLDDARKQSHEWRVFLDAVHYHGAGQPFNRINYVIQSGAAGVDDSRSMALITRQETQCLCFMMLASAM